MTASYLSRPRQLDIIDDTALSPRRQNRPGLSTVAPPQNRPDLSTVVTIENRPDLSTTAPAENRPDLSTEDGAENRADLSTGKLKKLDAKRKSFRISITRLCAAAGLHKDTYYAARRGLGHTRPGTMAKLNAALNRLAAGEKAQAPRSLCEITIRMLTATMAREVGADPALVLATNFDEECPNDPVWRQAARLRRSAIYLVVEGIGLPKADVGHAIGITRQGVHKAIAVIETERDKDPGFDAMMRGMMIMVAEER